MNAEQAVLATVEALERANIPYVLVGSLSSNFYGIARSTRDADFVIHFDPRSIPELVRHLGPSFSFDPKSRWRGPPARRAAGYPGTPFTIALFHLSDDAHDQERLRRRRQVTLFGRRAFLPTAEDVILTKLRWYLQAGRDKDREDVRSVILVQGDRLDWDYIRRWSDQHGTTALLEDALRSLPPA